MSYRQPNNVYVNGNTMYISGTHSFGDVLADVHLSETLLNSPGQRFALRNTRRYREAEQVLRENPQVKHLVGHSLGGAIADTLSQSRPDVSATVYGAPIRAGGPRTVAYRHPYDPISLMNKNPITVPSGLFQAHSYRGYARR